MSADFFSKSTFFSQEYPQSGCRSGPDVLSGLIWVQTVSKGDQQRTLVDKELKVLYLELKSDCTVSVIGSIKVSKTKNIFS